MPSRRPTQGEQCRIVVADPHPYAAEGLRALLGMLTDDMQVVAIARDAEMVLELVRSHSAGMLIVEPRLPGMMLTLQAIHEMDDEVKVVALTGHEDRKQATESIRCGAHAYISKQIDPEELVCVLRVVRAGRIVLSASAAAALMGEAVTEPAALTGQDRELLRLIIEGLDNGELARRLSVSESTLKRNIHRLLRKMNARNRIEAAVRAASAGLLDDV